MILTNELMIGDWVESRGKIEQVREVYDGYICTDSFEDSHDYHFDPIPLTAEILEKNGFVWDAYHKQLQLVCGSIHIGWGFYPECLSVSDWEDDGKNQISSLYCKYVHQLQNALRLCGIDKEITI